MPDDRKLPGPNDPTVQLSPEEASGLRDPLATREAPQRDGSGARHSLGGLTWAGDDSGLLTRTRLPHEAAPAVEPELPPGEQVGRYRLVRELAQGGMGVVYLAEDPQLGRPVALKLMRRMTSDAVRRFEVEARACARLRHPNVVEVYDAGQSDGRPFLVMALIEGDSLQGRLDREGPLAPGEVRRIGEALAGALAYVHERDVLHRDLKPENVLLTATGRPLLTDFGLAKLTAPPTRRGPLTLPGTVMGTPSYMSPEQARGETHRIDARTDVYGLGATLYALLTGKPPIEGPSGTDVIERVPREQVVDPREIRPSLPESLTQIVLRCMRKSPHERYPSALALQEALAAESGAPTESSPSPARPPASQLPLVLVAGALLCALVFLALTRQWSTSSPAGPSSSSDTQPASGLPAQHSPPAPTPSAQQTPSPLDTPPVSEEGPPVADPDEGWRPAPPDAGPPRPPQRPPPRRR